MYTGSIDLEGVFTEGSAEPLLSLNETENTIVYMSKNPMP